MLEPRASKPAFDPAYGLTGKELLSWSWAVERLLASRNYWIATTRPDGRPHAMPVWGLWWDDAVVFSTGESSLKARNIERDPRVVVHLESGYEVVIVEGAAARNALDRGAADAYEEKYSFPVEGDGLWLRVRPERAFAWLESSYPHSATRFDF